MTEHTASAAHPPAPLGRAVVRGGIVGIALVVGLGAVVLLLGNGPLAIDVWWHDLMVRMRTPLALTIAHGLRTVGATGPMLTLSIVVVAGLLVARRPRPALAFGAAVGVAELISVTLKAVIARPRPQDSLDAVAATSYPSGHTTMAAALTVVLVLLLRRRLLWIIAAVWIVAMAWSRTCLEAHWLTDVVAGGLLGSSAACLAWGAVDRIGRRRTPPPDPAAG